MSGDPLDLLQRWLDELGDQGSDLLRHATAHVLAERSAQIRDPEPVLVDDKPTCPECGGWRPHQHSTDADADTCGMCWCRTCGGHANQPEQPQLFATARATDPDSSHETVRSIAADTTLKAMIDDCAKDLGVFDDRDLTDAIHARYGVTPDRNIVARSRGLLEPSGTIIRVGVRSREDRRTATIHFTHWRNHNAQT